MSQEPGTIRFGVFEVHLATGELRKNGSRIKLQEQPFQVLAALLERPGQVVTKEQLKERLWAGDTFVDFDHSLSTAVNKIREALGDSASSPRFVETVPRRGYRFIGGAAQPDAQNGVDSEAQPKAEPKRLWLGVASVAGFVAIAGVGYWSLTERNSLSFGGLSSDDSPGPSWNISRLTSDSGLTYQPTVSADGSVLAYSSDRAGEGNFDIWVQKTDGSGLRRLTDDPADDYEPTLSPDGQTVAFRSERGESGIYVAPAAGGDAQLIFPGGRTPRFSPDGEWIAAATNVDFYPWQGEVYIISPDGRQRRRVAADFNHAAYPVWSPNGRTLLVSGVRTADTALPPVQRLRDWYAVTLESDAVDVEAEAILTAHQLNPTRNEQFVPTAWDADGWVYFSARQSDSENIWKLKVSPTTHKAQGPPLRVTIGAGVDQGPLILARGGMVYSSVARNVNLWSLPVEANHGLVLGEPTRLTSDPGNELYPRITPNGARLIYMLASGSDQSIWFRTMQSGDQRRVLRTTALRAVLSMDGSRIAFPEPNEGEFLLRVVSPAGGAVETLCPGASSPSLWSWSAEGRLLALRLGNDPITIGVLDTETCASTEILSYLNHDFFQAMFSEDDRWVAFLGWDGAQMSIWIAPFEGMAAIDHSRWIRVFGPSWADKPRWAPDGNSLYFTGQPEGVLVIYRQALEQRSKQPVGEPEVIYRFPNGHYSFREVRLTRRTIDVAADRIVYPMAELTGNIWLMEP